MKKQLIFLLVSIFTILLFVGGASATLIGDNVTISYDPSWIAASSWTGDVSEYDVERNVQNVNIRFTTDITADSMVISFAPNLKNDFTNKDLVIALVGIDNLSFDVVNMSDPSVGLSFGSNWLALDFSGVNLASGGTVTATMHNPIPAPILLLGTGLVGLAGFRRKSKKQ